MEVLKHGPALSDKGNKRLTNLVESDFTGAAVAFMLTPRLSTTVGGEPLS